MSAVEAIKLARKGLPVRSVAKRAGVPVSVAQALSLRGSKDCIKDLQRENARLKACLRSLIDQYDFHANELAAMARQAECVKNAAAKLLVKFDYRLKVLFDLNNEAEDALAGKVQRRKVVQ